MDRPCSRREVEETSAEYDDYEDLYDDDDDDEDMVEKEKKDDDDDTGDDDADDDIQPDIRQYLLIHGT